MSSTRNFSLLRQAILTLVCAAGVCAEPPTPIAPLLRPFVDDHVLAGAVSRLIGTPYEHHPLTAEARRALIMNGDNVIAIHCGPSGPPYVVDVGFAVRQS